MSDTHLEFPIILRQPSGECHHMQSEEHLKATLNRWSDEHNSKLEVWTKTGLKLGITRTLVVEPRL